MTDPERPGSGAGPTNREALVAGLAEVREQTLRLVAPLSDDALRRVHSPLMSPIVWDLGHIAEFEDLWLVRRLGELAGESDLSELYDAARTPRSRRGDLNLPCRQNVLARLAAVRQAALKALIEVRAPEGDELLDGGFVYEMVRRHEAQHQETMLQTILLMTSEPYRPLERWDRPHANVSLASEMVHVPPAEFELGAGGTGFAYDNERPRHRVALHGFEIGRYPVTNAEWLEFMAAGGYEDPALWSEAGWQWSRQEGLFAPLFWSAAGGECVSEAAAAADLARSAGAEGWIRSTSLGEEPVRPSEPVVHVGWHEAEAFARFRGCRLPTEVEWEMAAAWDPATGESRAYPWGEAPPTRDHANLGQLAFGVVPVGSYGTARSPVGCEQMVGDVWEWTSSPFTGYPGFRAFPYADYSEVFFGDAYRVLRGGSWATQPCVAGSTFRNWDYPMRRQIFAGLRLARDA